jgi:hypothetical protein
VKWFDFIGLGMTEFRFVGPSVVKTFGFFVKRYVIQQYFFRVALWRSLMCLCAVAKLIVLFCCVFCLELGRMSQQTAA